MTTPRDLLIVVMDVAAGHPVEPGDLSLALAGAEVIDLLTARAVTLEDGRVVPGGPSGTADRLLGEAESSLVRQSPYETVGEWLWRRGRELSAVYLAALEDEGQAARRGHRRWKVFRTSEVVLLDSPARRRALNRLRSDEPVLATLAATVGIPGGRTEDTSGVTDDAVATVLTAVDDAVRELAAERQRRARRREEAAADNVQRGY